MKVGHHRTWLMQARMLQLDHNQRLLDIPYLLELLGLDADIIAKDLGNLESVTPYVKPAIQPRVQCLMSSTSFTRWLWQDQSAFILVDGNEAESWNHVSAISLACLALQDFLREKPIVVLSFFCGLHTLQSDPLHGINGLIRSLTAQLLLKGSAHTDIVQPRTAGVPDVANLSSLFMFFAELVEQVTSEQIIVCMVDGISCFETLESVRDIRSVVRGLRDLTRRTGDGRLLKVMITSPDRCLEVKGEVTQSEHLILPQEIGSQSCAEPGANVPVKADDDLFQNMNVFEHPVY